MINLYMNLWCWKLTNQEQINNQCISNSQEENIQTFQKKIHNKCLSNDPKERLQAMNQLRHNLTSLPNKQQVWNDLVQLASDQNNDIKYPSASALFSAFYQLPDENKSRVWKDLHKLINGQELYIRYGAASVLGLAFSHVTNRQEAWSDLHKLTSDEDKGLRAKAASAFGFAFSQVPDKTKAWNDLHRLTTDVDSGVRVEAAKSLGSVFFQVLDKEQALNDLYSLTNDEDNLVRSQAAESFCSVFSYISDKQKAWNNLHKLSNDKDSWVRYGAVKGFKFAFSHVPNKQNAWSDLHRLTNDDDSYVRHGATFALGCVFSQVPDKQQAWNDLHKLANDKDSNVKSRAAEAIGSIFSHTLYKESAWEDLEKLSTDEDRYVRTYANHSLGKVSIFKASQSEKEEEYKRELEKAIKFFEDAAKESPHEWSNPAQFCLPFYHSFHTIIFKKQQAEDEVNKYLEEAKVAVQGSKNKELLLKAVECLAEALKEVRNSEDLDLETKKNELKFCRMYCEDAAEFIKDTEEIAPYATATMRRGLLILDKNLKGIIEGIQEKAKVAFKNAKGTDTEEIAHSICREVQKWKIGNQEEMNLHVLNLVMVLKSKIPHTPENKEILELIESLKYERDLEKQYSTLPTVIALIPTVTFVQEKAVNEGFENLQKGINKIDSKLEKMIVSLKPGPKGELVISKGLNIAGSGAQIVATIPLAEINYPELPKDLEEIKDKFPKVPELPSKLFNKIRGYMP